MIFDYLCDFYYSLFSSISGNWDMSLMEIEIFNGFTISFDSWLTWTMAIITIILIVIFLIMFTKWLFKLFGGLFKW